MPPERDNKGMKTITITLTNYEAKRMEYNLKNRYKTRAKLARLVELAAIEISAEQAKKESDEAVSKI